MCGDPVRGRIDKVYCKDRCRRQRYADRYNPVDVAKRLVVGMSDVELRAFIRSVLSEREWKAEAPRLRGRFMLRWKRVRIDNP